MRQAVLLYLAGIAMLLGAPSVPAEGENLSHYGFEPGQKLVYTSAGESKGDSSHRGSSTITTVTMIRKLPESGHWLAFAAREKERWYDYGSERQEQPAQTETAFWEISPDGHHKQPEKVGFFTPDLYFPALPRTDAELTEGWDGPEDVFGDYYSYKTAGSAEEGVFRFEATRVSKLNKIYGSEITYEYTFDREKKIITRQVSTVRQTYGFNSKGTSERTLDTNRILPEQEFAALRRDINAYRETKDSYKEMVKSPEEPDPNYEEKLASARLALDQALQMAETDVVRGILKEDLKEHDRFKNHRLNRSNEFEEILDRPTPEWTAESLDGKSYSTDGLRGQVVVLDFWYRGCGWCIRAMPQINQLTEDFKDAPVQILGMNKDRDISDAEFVHEKMELKYPTLKAEHVPEKYGVRGYPTLIIIDEEGVVRDVHVGWRKDLRKVVGQSIRDLLETEG